MDLSPEIRGLPGRLQDDAEAQLTLGHKIFRIGTRPQLHSLQGIMGHVGSIFRVLEEGNGIVPPKALTSTSLSAGTRCQSRQLALYSPCVITCSLVIGRGNLEIFPKDGTVVSISLFRFCRWNKHDSLPECLLGGVPYR